MKKTSIFFIGIVTMLYSCLEPFNPTVTETENSYLVFEGIMLNVLNESHIRLSYSQSLNSNIKTQVEANAIVSVETEPYNIIVFNPIGNGIYSAGIVPWNNYSRCKLKIEIPNRIYESDFCQIKEAPEIDSITWKADDEGLHILVNAHDVNNDTWYYRYEYIETAEYHSYAQSYLMWDFESDSVVTRLKDDQIFFCWSTFSSKDIMLATSKNLSKDLLIDQEVVTIPPESWKHSWKYSILLKQYALTKEAYDYLYNIEKSNEEIGSLFDPQPVNVNGNIHCISNPDDKVIGFFTVGSYTEKRKFINSFQLPKIG
ncbi:MAG: DUF4249 domain-containing protein [Bacteroidales bacterium]|nr:DUF4249 domain-containing protein [Bacteroidales bacterium]